MVIRVGINIGSVHRKARRVGRGERRRYKQRFNIRRQARDGVINLRVVSRRKLYVEPPDVIVRLP